jgi:tetratricopeptide (TPR) repeat protein
MKIHVTVALIICLLVPCSEICASASLGSLPAHQVQSRDTWRSIRTNNLFVVGNTTEEELREVALWLEFFHGAFAQLASRSVLDYSVPTTIIVFKDNASFIPFKPLYQGRPVNVAGYFQPGQDMNYIAFSLERGGRAVLSTAFHEYVHMHLRDSIPGAPLWLNEGLAEVYGSFVHSNGEALLGAPIPFYTRLLGQQELIPLTTLFSISTDSPHYNEQDKTGIFYAQSWALVHYLMLSEGGRQSEFKSFLNRISSGDESARALESAFGMSLDVLEKKFKEYVRRGEFPPQRVSVGSGPQPYAAMQRTSLSEGEANFYLGDLLLHIHREADAEAYFKHAISSDPGFTQTYASLGLLCMRQRRYAEARKYLQRAVVSPQSYLIHYLYAYVLSRERLTPGGSIEGFSPESARVMRGELSKAIKLAPEFADAYYLLALVNLVTAEQSGEQLDEAVSLVKRAQKLAPSKRGYALLLAQIYLHQREFDSARAVLEPLARQNTDLPVRADAQALLDSFQTPAGGPTRNKSEAATAQVGSSVMLELEETATTRSGTVTGGSASGVATRDGQTIDSSGSMPSVDEMLERYVQAVGGIGALTVIKTRVAKGTIDIVGVSRGGSVELYFKAPNKTLTVIRAQPLSLVKLGFNGRVGWAQTPGGLRIVKGSELVGIQRDSDFYNPATLRVNYPKINLLGRSKIGYREVYVLELHPGVGTPERLYMDANTYLPVRVNVMRTNASQRAVAVEIYLDDWREVDGIKVPFRITQGSPGLNVGITLIDIKYNVALDDSLFERPMK